MSTASPAPSRAAAMQQLLVPTGAAVVAILLARCADRAPAVRAKALSALGHWLQGWVAHPSGMATRDLARCLHLATELRLEEQGSRCAVQGTPGAVSTMVWRAVCVWVQMQSCSCLDNNRAVQWPRLLPLVPLGTALW